jgi:hypothetical protein
VQFTQSATEKLAGVMSDDSGDWTLFDGRVGDGVISFRRKVKGGATSGAACLIRIDHFMPIS